MKWNEVPQNVREECLSIYRRDRRLSAIVPLAEDLDMLPDTLLRRLQEMDTKFINFPQQKQTFPDKKQSNRNFTEVLNQIKQVQGYKEEKSISQDEATWVPEPERSGLPIAITWMADVHFGSLDTDYDLLEEHLNIIMNTPNMYVAFGGDEIDNFNAVKYPDGIWHDGVSPEDQMIAWAGLLKRMDEDGKIAALVWGNHTEFSSAAGINPYSAFFADSVSCPIFQDGGGVLNIDLGDAHYRLGLRHTFWGGSKLNITNSAKRMIQFGYPDLDAGFLGHTHEAAGEVYVQGGQEKIAVQGGTYKLFDGFRKRWVGNPHVGGFTIVLYPDTKKMILFRTPGDAQRYLLGAMALTENAA